MRHALDWLMTGGIPPIFIIGFFFCDWSWKHTWEKKIEDLERNHK